MPQRNFKNRVVDNHRFDAVPKSHVPRSTFKIPHQHKTTFDAGKLIPIYCQEVLPGDHHKIRTKHFCRLTTPIFPTMDSLDIDMQFFFVANRLLWNSWQMFQGEILNPYSGEVGNSTDYIVPKLKIRAEDNTPCSIYDYFGIPKPLSANNWFIVNQLPFRGYNLIWNEWYRDQNRQKPARVPVSDSDYSSNSFATNPLQTNDNPNRVGGQAQSITKTQDSVKNQTIFRPGNLFQLLPRGKRHDYFTSALPWPQKGEDVHIPLGNVAPIISSSRFATQIYSGQVPMAQGYTNESGQTGVLQKAGGSGTSSPIYLGGIPAGNANLSAPYHAQATSTTYYEKPPFYAPYVVDLTNTLSSTVNQFREAFTIARLQERDARGGTRYTEILMSHFGVRSPDARLQRPEYLGGFSTPLETLAIPQNSASMIQGSTSPLGTLGAIGFSADHRNVVNQAFTEHGYIIGLLSVRSNLTYQQGINRMFSRDSRFDFYMPVFSHLGEQAVLNKEIYAQGIVSTSVPNYMDYINPADGTVHIDHQVFGYQERWSEYKYKPSQITGLFRSGINGSLDSWHYGQYYSQLPLLNDSFIQENIPIDRTLAVPSNGTGQQFYIDIYFENIATRPMPVYSVPGLIDHL